MSFEFLNLQKVQKFATTHHQVAWPTLGQDLMAESSTAPLAVHPLHVCLIDVAPAEPSRTPGQLLQITALQAPLSVTFCSVGALDHRQGSQQPRLSGSLRIRTAASRGDWRRRSAMGLILPSDVISDSMAKQQCSGNGIFSS